ncbi:phosphoglucosamine mutase [Hahella chejuensis KCTC 2396]|uniref:Phosphoglucosamine mutase n=1 Tax=Hahella chejuensis (strain KCTC 2396) TaxID=349521 RepID=GLMM_HAHCH|nr:phosphoglucosamine mutase [Hahella chejuensis]Q2SML8.1 RecName: Full=Phosphoglucosamine mutase [Hahella chejuensis KCTC 2396]ABC28106.1 phosphoglucosamine mutase [Hahella chejuensis KCTC 2396]
MSKEYFGTDGIRGRVGEGPITPEFMLKLGWAAGRVFRQEGRRNRVLIGKDTRISGYIFESALESGLAAAGVDVAMLGPMPTPAIAYLTRTFRACAGIVISASHNPFNDNGVKFFSAEGTKLPDSTEEQIEHFIRQPMEIVPSSQLGKAARFEDAKGRYIEFCKSTVPFHMSFAGMRVVLDCAQGATYQVAPSVFKELGAKVETIGVTPDGLNINHEIGSTHPDQLAAKVVEAGADLGIAFDGDGDRVVMVDHKGEIVDGDEILYIIARDKMRKGRLKGGVVGTLMTNFGAELAFGELGIPFERANVGDRYVMEALLRNDWCLGGEGSGHIVCLDRTTTGDGIISSLQVLAALSDLGITLHEAKKGMSKLPQHMINVRVSQKVDIKGHTTIQSAVANAEKQFAGKGRVLLRSSGTEPVIRVMAEGEDEAKVRSIVAELAKIVEGSV